VIIKIDHYRDSPPPSGGGVPSVGMVKIEISNLEELELRKIDLDGVLITEQ
jgi:hypothetical protein